MTRRIVRKLLFLFFWLLKFFFFLVRRFLKSLKFGNSDAAGVPHVY